MAEKKTIQGAFDVIDSFAIRKRNEFYLIGNLKEGIVHENWFVRVPLNKTISITFRIFGIENVEMTNKGGVYTLLILKYNDSDAIDLLLGLNIGSELLDITIEGED